MKHQSFSKDIKAVFAFLMTFFILGTNFTSAVVLADGTQPRVTSQKSKKKSTYKSKMSDLIRLTKPKQKIPNLATNTPQINKFTSATLKKYHLLGYRWRDKNNISYYYSNLTKSQIKLSEEEIRTINKLNIVHLVQTDTHKGANITIATEKAHHNTELGYTDGTFNQGGVKGLSYFYRQRVMIEDDTIHKYNTKARYRIVFKHTILHELGHALGLDHIKGKKNKTLVMYPDDNDYILADKNYHLIIDQEYINGLALLYNN